MKVDLAKWETKELLEALDYCQYQLNGGGGLPKLDDAQINAVKVKLLEALSQYS